MSKLDIKRVLRQLEPNLPKRKNILDAWLESSLKNLIDKLSATGDLKNKDAIAEIRKNAYRNVSTSVEKINKTEDVWAAHLKDYEDRSKELVDSLIGVIIGSTARLEAESQSDIDINLIIEEPPKIRSLKDDIEEFQEDLQEETSKKGSKYLPLDTSHCKPFPMRNLGSMGNMANSILGYHGLGDPSRFNFAFLKCVKKINKWELIDHLGNRASRVLKERKHGAIKIWYYVMMYSIRMFALCYLKIKELCSTLPKPYWKICDDLYNRRRVNKGVLHDCAVAIKETMRYRHLEDREKIGKRKYRIGPGHESDTLYLVTKSFYEVREEIRLKRP